MVPNNANIVNITLVLLQVATLFGFKFATNNITMVPNNVNIVNITLVLLQVTTQFALECATSNIATEQRRPRVFTFFFVFVQTQPLLVLLERVPLRHTDGVAR